MALVELARFNKPIEADLARLYLDSQGVETVVFGSGSFGEDGLIRLMVLEEDWALARRALASYRP